MDKKKFLIPLVSFDSLEHHLNTGGSVLVGPSVDIEKYNVMKIMDYVSEKGASRGPRFVHVIWERSSKVSSVQ